MEVKKVRSIHISNDVVDIFSGVKESDQLICHDGALDIERAPTMIESTLESLPVLRLITLGILEPVTKRDVTFGLSNALYHTR